jgi:hypothetical protein
MRHAAAALLALIAAGALAGCGDEAESEAPIRQVVPHVALTLDYPGHSPWALITYRSDAGRRCHALGTLTAEGPRLLGLPHQPLGLALSGQGRCLAPSRPVSLQVSDPGRNESMRVIGGLARRDVARVTIAGQRIRPTAGGGFLIVQPVDAGSLGKAMRVQLRDGRRLRLALATVAS